MLILLPRQATIRVTDRCNARCSMCSLWRRTDGSCLPLSAFHTLPPSLTTISLSGGEPFLREDLPEIVAIIKKICKKSRIVILTNGLLVGTIIRQMRAIRTIDPHIAVRLPLDGIGTSHDKVRGVENAYGQVMETLRQLKNLRIRDVGVTITVNDHTIEEIEKVYRLAGEKKVRFNCQVTHSSNFYYGKENEGIHRKDRFREQLRSVISRELRSFDIYRAFKAYYYRGLWNYVNSLPRLYPCEAGRLFFYMNQEGNVYPCPFIDKEMGNLLKDDFGVIWNGSQAARVRQCVKECGLQCWTTCTVAPAIRNNPVKALRWIAVNTLKAYAGKDSI